MNKILVVEDEPKMQKLLRSGLELEGYAVLTASDGHEGYEMAKREKPDLIILDVMMPKMSGYDVCKLLRKEGDGTPILMLTAKGQEAEKVVGFDLGADDYVAKPFSGMELMARVRALLRRQKRADQALETASFDGIEIDFRKMQATRKGKSLGLTTKEFQILQLLIQHEGQVISRRQFLEQIWGYDEMPSTRTVDNQIATLRQKLAEGSGKAEKYIFTLHGIGYKFVR